MPVTRTQVHDAVDEYLDQCKYGERIPIENGKLSIELLMDKGQVDCIICERQRKKVLVTK
jgi:hypothetical protein